MKRLLCLVGVVGIIDGAMAQTADPKAARCFQLADLGDRYLTKRNEGSGGPNMIVLGARLDCQKGRYDSGIRDLEKVLRDQRIPIPPPP
jgi:hypothetical protein